MLTNVQILSARKLDAFFFKRTFGSRFFAENIWVQIWLIVAHMDLQPDNTYLNNQRLAFERTQIDHHEDLTERGSESKYFGTWCIHRKELIG